MTSIAAPAPPGTTDTEFDPATELVAAGTVVRAVRRRGVRRRRRVLAGLLLLVLAAYVASLLFGRTFYGPAQVWAVIRGEEVRGASFTVGRLRLPRATAAAVVGACFGLGGVTFQTLLRNPLASPDMIGINAGASAAAVFAIVMLTVDTATVTAMAIVASLVVALVIYLLSFKGGSAGTRLILIGIGVASMLNSFTAYALSRAIDWDYQEAMRWLTGSLNGVSWGQVRPVAIALLVLGPLLVAQSRRLAAMQLGDDTAAAVGVAVERTRLTVVLAATVLLAFATAATGPIAFVAFLAGPIAVRLIGGGVSALVPAALVGALLVLVADFAGQYLLGTRYPVGVVTGVLGAPYLLFLIVRPHRPGAMS